MHIDNLRLICDSVHQIKWLKGELTKYFPISDLGEVHHLLGIKISHNRDKCTITLSQEQYILNLLEKYHYKNLNPVATPMCQGCTAWYLLIDSRGL